jgi:hypothetical protein
MSKNQFKRVFNKLNEFYDKITMILNENNRIWTLFDPLMETDFCVNIVMILCQYVKLN